MLNDDEGVVLRGHVDLANFAAAVQSRPDIGWPRHIWARFIPCGDEGRPELMLVQSSGRGAFPITAATTWPADWLLHWSGGPALQGEER